ncbi:MAG: aldehyde dehydrogenase family protein [Polyangiales bacterium]
MNDASHHALAHTAPPAPRGAPTSDAALEQLFSRQRAAFAAHPPPSRARRLEALAALRATCAYVRKELADALVADFGSHDPSIGLIWELSGVLGRIALAADQLDTWMRDAPRAVHPSFGDTTCFVRYQPKGVIGNVVPWNFPVDIALGPLVDILAAGNRAIVKPSEWTPHCADLVRRAIAAHFDPDEVSVVIGGLALSQRFIALPWDHLLYTGNPEVGRLVLAAAAANLTPVTLELGGKCPAILAPDRVSEDSIAEILMVKAVKSGQVCINTDYVLVPEARLDETVALLQRTWSTMFPRYVGNPANTGIINTRHFARLRDYVTEARARGVRVVELGDERADEARRQLPLTLLIDPPDDLAVMQEEIFGPLLPIKTYRTLDDAITYVNARARPLALYLFSDDAQTVEHVLTRTVSGGVAINTVAAHAGVPTLPFGGIGNSGMGAHHGHEGFLTFSHARAVYQRGSVNPYEVMRPPWGEPLAAVAAALVDGA